MPDRHQQRVTRRKARRKKIVSGLRTQRVRRRAIRRDVASIGPDVAKALAFFRAHDVDPEYVRHTLTEERPLWTFASDGDVLTLERRTRDMILGLMTP